MTKRQLFAWGFFAGLLLLLYQIGVIFRPFFIPILWATILAHVSFPVHRRLSAVLGFRGTLSAALLTIGLLAIVVVPVVLLSILLIDEAGAAYVQASDWVKAGGLKQLPQELSRLPIGGETVRGLLSRSTISQEDLEAFLLQNVRALSGFVVEQLGGLAKNIFLLIANFLVMMVTLFFFFRDGPRLVQGLYDVIPLEEAHKQRIFARLDATMTAVVKGIMLTAVVQGVLAGLAYATLGAPFPVFLMALTILLAPLPFGGTGLVWVPVAGYRYWTGPLWKAIAMLALGLGVVTMIDNFLRPLLIGQDARLAVLFLFFSILGGLAAYGLIGLFLGPIFLAIFITALQIYREEYHEKSMIAP